MKRKNQLLYMILLLSGIGNVFGTQIQKLEFLAAKSLIEKAEMESFKGFNIENIECSPAIKVAIKNALQKIITQKAVQLWVEKEYSRMKQFEYDRRKGITNGDPEAFYKLRESPLEWFFIMDNILSHQLKKENVEWKMSLQDILNVPKGQKILSKCQGNFSKLSLTSLDGLMNIQSIEGCEHLKLNNNFLVKVEKNAFEGLVNLNTLNLSWNNLKVIEEDTFKELVDLKRIDLQHNQLEEIEKNTFNCLVNLKTLLLDFNKLKRLKGNTFNNLNELVSLSLSNNELMELEEDLFRDLINLKILYLNENNLEKINQSHLSSLTNLMRLSLRNNPLKDRINFRDYLPNLRSLKI